MSICCRSMWGGLSACGRLLAGFLEAAVKHRLPLLPWFFLGALCCRAGLITSTPAGGATTTFAGGTTCFGGPDAGFTIILVTNPVCWNVSTYFGFSNNGTWNNPTTGFALIGANSTTAAFTIDLGGLYAAVGGFMNYNAPVSSPGPTISALAADGVTVLESYDLSLSAPISTPGGSNAGAFRGIARPSADIRYFELANSYIAIHDITPGIHRRPRRRSRRRLSCSERYWPLRSHAACASDSQLAVAPISAAHRWRGLQPAASRLVSMPGALKSSRSSPALIHRVIFDAVHWYCEARGAADPGCSRPAGDNPAIIVILHDAVH